MWRFTLLLAVLALGLGADSLAISNRGNAQVVKPSLRSKECFSGPSYWCQNLKTAKSCGAVKHCIQTVWEHQTLPEDNDDICQICKNMVREARDTLRSNETQEELKEVFEGSCKLIPVKIVRAECLKIADEFVPELVETLASQMNPNIVCATAGLCNNAWVDGLLQEQKASQLIKDATKPTSTGMSCEVCQRVAGSRLDKIHQTTQSDILDYFLELCGYADSFSDACRNLVVDSFPSIYDRLSSLDGGSFCKLVDACDTIPKIPKVKTSPIQKKPTKIQAAEQVKDDAECQFCEALVKHLRDIVVANTTESEFRMVMEGLCKQTGNFKQECLALVDQYYDVIYQFLVNELDPEGACRLMTLCPNPGVKAIRGQAPIWLLRPVDTLPIVPAAKLQAAAKIETVPLTKIQPARSVDENDKVFFDVLASEKLLGQDEANAIATNNMPEATEVLAPLPETRYSPQTFVSVQNQETCILCEYILHEVEVTLSNRTTEEEVKNAVLGICKRLPSSLVDQCTDFVSKYGDAIIFVLAHELDPAKVCPMLKLCPAAMPKMSFPKAFKSKDPDSKACTLCVFAMTELDRMLEDNKTEQAIKQSMERLCRLAPTSMRDQCDGFVDTYTDEVIEMFLADFTPEEVCAALKLCAPKGLKRNKMANRRDLTVGEFMEKVKNQREMEGKGNKAAKADVQCVLCEFAMAQLDKMVIKNSTEDEIKRALEFLCDHLPSSVADQCIAFVEEYGDAIFKLLVNEMSPSEVCKELQMCPNTLNLEKVKEVKAESVVTCEICEIIVEYLDKLLEDDTVEESIDILIEKVCVAVPEKSREQCRAMVDTYGPYIISQLGLIADKRQVCEALHLCQTPGKVQLLGGKHCSWGPAYWCVSPAHANSCNALEHCQTKVWKKAQP